MILQSFFGEGVGFSGPFAFKGYLMKKRLFDLLIFISSVSTFWYIVKCNASAGDKAAATVAIFLAVFCICLGRRDDD